ALFPCHTPTHTSGNRLEDFPLLSTNRYLQYASIVAMNRFMKSDSEPKLAAPGAGLPAIELWVARLFFGRRLRKGTRERFTAEFQAERQKIAAELRPLTVEQASRR